MTARRLKSLALLAGVAVNALVLMAWTQAWFTVTLVADELGGSTLAVGGDVAAGGLAALGLAGLALVGALSIAGPAFRIVLGVLQFVLGATVVLSSVIAIGDPLSVAAPAVTDATGVSGADSVAGLVASATLTVWPWVAAVLGGLGGLLGIAIFVTSRRWPGPSRKYQSPAASTPAAGPAPAEAPGAAPEAPPTSDAIADWDALSDGADPTSR